MCDGTKDGLIYTIDRFERIPEAPGAYVFSRVLGDSVTPLYIVKAEDLRRRIGQQLKNNVRLMRAIENTSNGHRRLHIAQLNAKAGQSAKKAVAIIEAALISAALVEGHQLVNIQGTKTLVHTVASSGNREAKKWLPESTIQVRRA